MRSSFAASRTSGRGGWDRASVAACSKRTARFDEDIFDIPLMKSPDWRRRERYQPLLCETSRIRLSFSIPFEAWVDGDIDKVCTKKKPRRFPDGAFLRTSLSTFRR